MSNSDLNPLGQALAFASQDKYKDDKVVQSLLTNFNYQKAMYEMTYATDTKFMLKVYEEGLKGTKGFNAITLDYNMIQKIMSDTTFKLTKLVAVQQAGECLIRVMQALGEDIQGY